MILVIDNYDSFVHNVARYFEVLGAPTRVVRNDALTIADIRRLRPEAIVISPGPCTPAEAGISCAVLEDLSGVVPILGVCLGHQCLGAVHGGRVVRARVPLHGQSSPVTHDDVRLFAGLPSPLAVGRYHSLIVEPTQAMIGALTIDAVSEEGEIMALSHRTHPTYGVQFHPESVLTVGGLDLFGNFLSLAKAWRQDAVA
jgi:para-aminobenzoate synthetase component 2